MCQCVANACVLAAASLWWYCRNPAFPANKHLSHPARVSLQGVDLKGVPALAPCSIILSESSLSPADAAAVRDKEQRLPNREQMGFRDPSGAYSAAQPFWANVADAKWVFLSCLCCVGSLWVCGAHACACALLRMQSAGRLSKRVGVLNNRTATFQSLTTDTCTCCHTCCRLMTAESSDRTVIHVELELSDSGMRFGAGDAVGVLPANDPALVAGLLARLGVDGDAVFEVQPASGRSGRGSVMCVFVWSVNSGVHSCGLGGVWL